MLKRLRGDRPGAGRRSSLLRLGFGRGHGACSRARPSPISSPTGPGGGYDTYGRLIARYLQKHLPGSRVLVRNVPGAGHIVGANTIYAAKPDGPHHRHVQHRPDLRSIDQAPGRAVRSHQVQLDRKGRRRHARADDVQDVRASRTSTTSSRSKAPIKFAAAGVGSAAYNDTQDSRRRAASQCPDRAGLHRQ